MPDMLRLYHTATDDSYITQSMKKVGVVNSVLGSLKACVYCHVSSYMLSCLRKV